MYKKLMICTAIVLLGWGGLLAVKLPATPDIAYASEEGQISEGNGWSMWEFCQQMMQLLQGMKEEGDQDMMLTGGKVSDDTKEVENEWLVDEVECYDWVKEQSRQEIRMNCH